jgi:hypothetical protein
VGARHCCSVMEWNDSRGEVKMYMGRWEALDGDAREAFGGGGGGAGRGGENEASARSGMKL